MNVPFLTDGQIHLSADSFLQKYHHTLDIPVPIEEIIEQKLDIQILSIKGFESGCEVSGSLSKDFKTILIDEDEFERQIQRARFTLAHEVGHSVLHHQLFTQSGGFNDLDSFIKFQNNLIDKDYKKLEIQAYRFAEEIIFPREKLKKIIEEEVKVLGGLPSLNVNDLNSILSKICQEFDASERAVFNKIKRDYPILKTIQIS